PPRDVPPFFRVPDAVNQSGTKVDPTRYLRVGQRIFGTRENIEIAQVIASNGPRVPAYETAPRSFRIAWVLVTRPLEKAGDVVEVAQQLDAARKVWEGAFDSYTGGRGAMCTQVSGNCGVATAK